MTLLARAIPLLAVTLASLANAQQYPTRPVRMLIPFTPGSSADIIARAIEPDLRARLGQAVVIDNRGGAGGNIAAEMCAKAVPDGYTIMMGTIGTQAINYSLYSKLNYHPLRDFTPIVLVGDSPNVLVTTPRLPVNNLKELIAYAKANPAKLNFSSSGAGTSVHLSGELLNSMAGVKTIHVPFKGAAESLTALLGGQVDFSFASLSSAIPFIKSGKLKGHAITAPQRSASIPDLPTMSEAGIPGFVAVAWYGLVGPAGIQPPVVATLSKASIAALGTKDVQDRLFASGVEAHPADGAAFGKLIRSEIDKWAKVVKASGAKAD